MKTSLIKILFSAVLFVSIQTQAGTLTLLIGNYKPLLGELECDISVQFNSNTSKLYLTMITNQRTAKSCEELGETLSYKCDEAGTCTGINSEDSVEITSDNSLLRLVDNTSWVFSDNNSIKPPNEFIDNNDYGFHNQTGRSFTSDNRCAFFFEENGPRYVYCNDESYAREVQCPLAIKIAKERAIKKCEKYHPKGCTIRSINKRTYFYIGRGEYDNKLLIYFYPNSSLVCTAQVMAGPQ